ncbi:hypothetical protein GCM10022224_097630 [Nonomuraea antimicrobica]|uniref:Excreted virulence factor EspC, type VII ESX diderm n=1 Tax=Nonomuraea antimicrobica TaxID=561173 RepID=A0ABP7EAN2_9ACTN
MSDTNREIQTVYGTRLVSAGQLSEAADGLDRVLQGTLDRAHQAGTGDLDELSAQFDAEFAELPGLTREAFAATARLLRERADKVRLSERNHANAEQANVQSAGNVGAGVEEA